jgi:hypothetical protein
MIKFFMICIVLMLTLSFGTAYAAEIKDVELKDGSVITGEVISLSNGIYTIKSDLLGIIKLEDSKVRAIREKSFPTSAIASTANSNTAGDAQALQQKMTNDKEIMNLVQSLQNDPEFKKLLEDPKIMNAVNAGDVAALTADPRFMKLLSNPTVQEIQRKVK